MMGQTDIGRLFEILMKYQELSPEIARRVLERILMILQGWHEEGGEDRLNKTEESTNGNDKM